MITHAFFKALLFLGAGSVIHGMHDEQDMRSMGALRKVMPITAATFIVGWLAIPASRRSPGFWSKDEILLASCEQEPGAVGRRLGHRVAHGVLHEPPGVPRVLRRGALGGRADAGSEEHGHVQPHESPWLMWVPLVVLAVALGDRRRDQPAVRRLHFLEHWLEPSVRRARTCSAR